MSLTTIGSGSSQFGDVPLLPRQATWEQFCKIQPGLVELRAEAIAVAESDPHDWHNYEVFRRRLHRAVDRLHRRLGGSWNQIEHICRKQILQGW